MTRATGGEVVVVGVKLGSRRRQRNSMPPVAPDPIIIVSTGEGSAAAVPCACRKWCERSVLEGVRRGGVRESRIGGGSAISHLERQRYCFGHSAAGGGSTGHW